MDIKETLQKGYDKVEEAVKNTVDNCKLEVKIAEKERDVKTLTKEIGEIVVAELEGGAVMSDVVMEKYAAIKCAKETIAELAKDKKVTKITCPVCGEKVPVENMYCGKCGAQVREEAVEEEVEAEEVEKESEGTTEE